MHKKQEKDFIFDSNLVNGFNVGVKTKRQTQTWNQNLVTLQRPEIPKEAQFAFNGIRGSLNKLGNLNKIYVSEPVCVESVSARLDINKSFPKEDFNRNISEKFKEIEGKVVKKTEESKQLLEISSILSVSTKRKIEELEDKVAKLKFDLIQPLNLRKQPKTQRKSKFLKDERVIFPSIYRAQNF